MKNKISLDEMKKAIQESGYLIEQRVAKKFEQEAYSIIPNQIIVDPVTDVRREIDLVAMKINYDNDNYDHFGYEIICECENNYNPIVFFQHEFKKYNYVSELKSSGFIAMWDLFKKSEKELDLGEVKLATQYCGFKQIRPKYKKEDKWIALHSDEQHDTFNKLKKSVQHRKKRFEPRNSKQDFIEGRIHYPLLVLNDGIFLWNEDSEDLIPVNHVVYKVQDFNDETNYYENYYVDVIVEGYLPKYIEKKKKEWSYFKKVILDNRSSIIAEQKKRRIRSQNI